MDGYRVTVRGTQSIDRDFEDIDSAMKFSNGIIREASRDRNERVWVDVLGPDRALLNSYGVKNGLIVGVM